MTDLWISGDFDSVTDMVAALQDPNRVVTVRNVTAVPVVRMGGLSPAFYVTDDPSEADAWLMEAVSHG